MTNVVSNSSRKKFLTLIALHWHLILNLIPHVILTENVLQQQQQKKNPGRSTMFLIKAKSPLQPLVTDTGLVCQEQCYHTLLVTLAA